MIAGYEVVRVHCRGRRLEDLVQVFADEGKSRGGRVCMDVVEQLHRRVSTVPNYPTI